MRQAPSVAIALSVKDEGGGFRHASSAPFPDLKAGIFFSTIHNHDDLSE
jgi:hypothetical protein